MSHKLMIAALVLVVSGVFGIARPRNAMPSDLRDAPADNRDFDISLRALDKAGGNIPEPEIAAAAPVPVWPHFEDAGSIGLEAGYRCGQGTRLYAVYRRSDGRPALSVLIDGFVTSFPLPDGYDLSMEGDRPGVGVYLERSGGRGRSLLGVVGQPAYEGCVSEGSEGRTQLPLQSAPGVRVLRGKSVKTGFFSPPCYKNATTGAYKLEFWHLLRLSLAGETVEIKTPGSEQFTTREECREFYLKVTGKGK